MAINIKPGERILIVAPHPDDESIGCGGVIRLYHDQVDVLLVTDGYDSSLDNRNIAELRQQEFVRAMEIAQVHGYKMLHIPEHQIENNNKILLQEDYSQYSHIFVPNRYEGHKDHVDVYKYVKKAVDRNVKLYEYEVWTPVRNPNIIVDISAVYQEKISLIQQHTSQLKELDYVGIILGLNAYRGRTRGMEFAEAFYCATEKKHQRYRKFKRFIKGLIK